MELLIVKTYLELCNQGTQAWIKIRKADKFAGLPFYFSTFLAVELGLETKDMEMLQKLVQKNGHDIQFSEQSMPSEHTLFREWFTFLENKGYTMEELLCFNQFINKIQAYAASLQPPKEPYVLEPKPYYGVPRWCHFL